MTHPFPFPSPLNNPLTFVEYLDEWKAKNALPLKGLDRIGRRYRYYSKYNLERQERVENDWIPSDTFSQAALAIPKGLTFLFITDDWCIDSAYSLPMLQKVASERPDLDLIIGLKDDNLELLDRYLTDGARSIPKLVIFNSDGVELAVWGPQPEAIRLIRKNLIDSKAEGSVVSGTTIEWYAEQGIGEVEKELTHLLSGL